MKLRRLVRLVLATLVVAAMTLALLARPFDARGSSMSDSAMQTMAQSDMPCCPKKTNDCKECPLLALCMLQNVMADPAAGASTILLGPHMKLAALDDAPVAGLDRPPPDYPPRRLV